MKVYIIVTETTEGIEIEKVFINKYRAINYFKKMIDKRNDLFAEYDDVIVFDNDDAYYFFEKEIEQWK